WRVLFLFFFSSRRRHTSFSRDWSSDVCSSDLVSRRWMDFEATLMTPTGERRTAGGATATNIEAGFTGWSVAGVNVVPQAQYTREIGRASGRGKGGDVSGGRGRTQKSTGEGMQH